jgi:hypothetical protein
MGANSKAGLNLLISNESGQSLIEVVLIVPFMMALVLGLIRAATIVQMAIVNQKYARAQALFITYNSPVYPRAEFTESWYVPRGLSQMVVGVQDQVIGDGSDDAVREENQQRASVYPITPKGAKAYELNIDDGSVQEEPSRRDLVRIRNTISLCTPLFAIRAAGGGTSSSGSAGGSYSFQKITPESIKASIKPNDAFVFCWSDTNHE